jgi:hypothetical protein
MKDSSNEIRTKIVLVSISVNTVTERSSSVTEENQTKNEGAAVRFSSHAPGQVAVKLGSMLRVAYALVGPPTDRIRPSV